MRTQRFLESKAQARIDAAAADWLVRRSEVSNERDNEEFYSWLAADPRHGEAYETLARIFEDVGQVDGIADLPRDSVWRRIGGKAPAVAFACVAMLAALWALPSLTLETAESFETAIGQTRTLTLADGSSVTLGADSEIQIRIGESARGARLERGEAFFDVAPDPARPFIVRAGGAFVRVVGTRFDVHRGVQRVRISVLEGRVEVRDARALTLAPAAVRVLTAGQRTEVEERPPYVAVASVSPPVESAPVTDMWRSGRLTYDDVRLEEVIADINRYYAPGARLMTPEVADLRVTAAFETTEIESFFSALEAALPVSAAREAGGAYRISAAAAGD